jgi:polyisoprenoid-binding protein YceI
MRADTPLRTDRFPPGGAPWLAISLLLVAHALPAQTRTYRIEPSANSRFSLEVFKTGLMSGKKHLLVFERFQGRLDYDGAEPEKSSIVLTVEPASLVVQDDWVNENERKKIAAEALNKQLDVAHYPEIRFRSASIRAVEGSRRYEVQGELTIRGVARPAAVQVTLREQGGNLVFEGEAEVKMKEYGMKPPSAALGLIGTKNEMTVRFLLQAAPPGP